MPLLSTESQEIIRYHCETQIEQQQQQRNRQTKSYCQNKLIRRKMYNKKPTVHIINKSILSTQ